MTASDQKRRAGERERLIWRSGLCVLSMISGPVSATPTRPGEPTRAAYSSRPDADALLHTAMAAQGGEAVLRGLRSVRITGAGYRNMVEQSERPEGPYLIETERRTITDDLTGGRYLEQTEATNPPFSTSTRKLLLGGNAVMRVNGGVNRAGTAEDLRAIRERAALSPERLLLTAAAATDRQRGADVRMQGVDQNVVTFTLDGAGVTLYLNANTHLPTAVDYSGPAARAGFQAFLGDATQRTLYSLWWLDPSGLRYPLLWNVETNGLADRVTSFSQVEVNTPLAEDDLAVPQDIRAAFRPDLPSGPNVLPLGLPSNPAREIAPGIVFIPGAWNVTIVHQNDGLVIIEAPIGSGYSVKVLDEAQRRFPGIAVKAVITTSDAWPHLAGIREYVARGIPVFALNLNTTILQRVLAAPYSSKPDQLEKRPRPPMLHLVAARTVIGSGVNRIELYPLRGETSERQMMAYFPALRLLYGSDAFQGGASGTYSFPQAVSELTDAVKREKLDVDRFFMMHVDPTPWSNVSGTGK